MAKVIRDGQKLAKSLAGPTTLAATLVVRVAISSANSEIRMTRGLLSRDSRTTGSQIASPKMSTEAEVTATPMNEKSVIVVGNP